MIQLAALSRNLRPMESSEWSFCYGNPLPKHVKTQILRFHSCCLSPQMLLFLSSANVAVVIGHIFMCVLNPSVLTWFHLHCLSLNFRFYEPHMFVAFVQSSFLLVMPLFAWFHPHCVRGCVFGCGLNCHFSRSNHNHRVESLNRKFLAYQKLSNHKPVIKPYPPVIKPSISLLTHNRKFHPKPSTSAGHSRRSRH